MKNSYLLLLLILGVGLYYGGRYLYFKPNVIQGEMAPEITGVLANGTQFSLKELRGSYVLIDFWGSWCGPCRQQNPALVELYAKHGNAKFEGDYGFEIVSIGLESHESRWLNAIQQDGLTWPYQLAQFEQFSSPLAKEYGVRQIPTKFLLDPEGRIIGINQSISSIEKMLSKKMVAMAN